MESLLQLIVFSQLVLQTRSMRYYIITAVLLAVAVAAVDYVSIEEFDLASVLQDEAKTKQAFECMMDRGPCGELQTLRDSLPQMIQTKCSQCTPKQKEKFDQASKMLCDKRPKEFEALVAKYSPKSE